MLNVMNAIKSRRAVARSDRELRHIIHPSGTSPMRDELVVMHQRQLGRSR